ncbi:MAG: TCP-1/cpn60 chaperonin family protein [Nanoarchaeota archaeon]|nr:TCP-1/cpn60 chaperonin family protein [Nanoarchaeota archaeon]
MSQVQPIFILPEGYTRTTGKDAQRNNILAAKLVAETVRTTLGPKGMDKMIVNSVGDVTVTNDGVTILGEMQIEHPAAKMIAEIAKTQEDQVGDGTTTAVVLAGELLKNADRLLDKEIHPTLITKGYRQAAEKAQEILNKMSKPIIIKDTDLLNKIAITAMTGKGAESSKEHLAGITVKAICQVFEEGKINRDDIKVEKKTGEGIENSELIQGIILDKERVHSRMPKQVKNAKIALLNVALEIKNPEIDTKVQITDPIQLEAFMEQEENTIKEMTNKIILSGANVVVCQKGIDDLAQHFLAKTGVYAVRRVEKTSMERIAKATGARIISNIKELNKEHLGTAGIVEEQKTGNDKITYIKECKNAKAVTFLIRGGTQHVVNEAERAVKDAIGDVIAALIVGKVVGGAGATEIALARKISDFANSLSGREQLAVQAFADAIEVIPRTLAENSGLDQIDMITAMKSKHEGGMEWAGINVFSGKVVDSWKEGVIEPLKIKTQAIKSASEVAELILRIDDIIAGAEKKEHLIHN